MFKKVESEMVKFPYVASPGMMANEALIYMKECQIRHLPIMEGTDLVGIVSQRDIVVHKNPGETLLDEIMIKKPFVVSQEESLSAVVSVMAEKKYGCTLVVNKEKQLIGIFTTIDALRLLEKFLEGDSKFYNSFENIIPLKEVVEWI